MAGSELIWIYIVFQKRINTCSAGQGLNMYVSTELTNSVYAYSESNAKNHRNKNKKTEPVYIEQVSSLRDDNNPS